MRLHRPFVAVSWSLLGLLGFLGLVSAAASRPAAPPAGRPAAARLAAQGDGDGGLQLAVYDANPLYSPPGRSLPLPGPDLAKADLDWLLSRLWRGQGRPFSPTLTPGFKQVAADGATLLFLQVGLPAGTTGQVTFSLAADANGGEPGGLYAVTDQRVVDRTTNGGTIDGSAYPASVTVPVSRVGRSSWAFALYRSPRNFDPTHPLAHLTQRQVSINLALPGRSPAQIVALPVARPLVLLQHGTFGDTDNWLNLPLWQKSAHDRPDTNAFDYDAAVPVADRLPFSVDRISFQWNWISTGPVAGQFPLPRPEEIGNATLILQQVQNALENWRQLTFSAGTQVDIICHSYGGTSARYAAQTQRSAVGPDQPLPADPRRNFRAATNWGHGAFHKLITLASTHRGSAITNTLAYLNEFGQSGIITGNYRELFCSLSAIDIGWGGIADQLVVSPALQNLKETRVPGHAFVGSGLIQYTPDQTSRTGSAAQYWGFQCFDKTNGGYTQRGDGTEIPVATSNCNFYPANAPSGLDYCNFNQLTNYVFNLDYFSPPLGFEPDCALEPDYDLTVSAHSSQGGLPDAATTTAKELDPDLVGRLIHGEFLTNALVSQRLVALLQAATTSDNFAFFPDYHSVPVTPAENRLMGHGSAAGLTKGKACNSTPGPGFLWPSLKYDSAAVWPRQVTLTNTDPTPLLVYGKKGTQVTIAQSIQDPADAGQTQSGGHWCKVEIVVPDDARKVVKAHVHDITLVPALLAQAPGTAKVTVNLIDDKKNVITTAQATVTVAGTPVEVQPVRGGPGGGAVPTFAFLSAPGFDARTIVPESIRIDGSPSVQFGRGQRVLHRDIDGDGDHDALFRHGRISLGGPRGARIRIHAQTADGSFVEGFTGRP